MASQTHKDRVSEFNSKLESLSEHHDIPKVRLILDNPRREIMRPLASTSQVGPG